MDGELLLQVSEDGADAERLATMISYLRAELLQLDVCNVVLVASEAPPGSRSIGANAVDALLVALGQSADGLSSLLKVTVDWLRRGDGPRRSVRLELDGDVLVLSHASTADQERLVELFVSKHAVPKGRT